MKTPRIIDSLIISILKQAETGMPVHELCRALGMSSATFYKWRAKYGDIDADLISRMKEPGTENAPFKRMHAEKRLKVEVINKALDKQCRH